MGNKKNLSRRDFLKITGATGAAALINTSGLLGTVNEGVLARANRLATKGGTLIEGRTYELLDLDPATTLNTEAGQIVMPRLYETLVTSGPNLEPVAKLATSWTMTDPTTWEFKIRAGVKFHKGQDLTVEDVKWSYDHIMNKDVGHPAARYLGEVKSVDIVDKETIRFKLSSPNVVFPNQQHWCYIHHRSTADQPKDYLKQNVNGTGPFMLDSWQPDKEMKLVRHPNYWKTDRPYLDAITMVVFPEEASALAALRAGKIDFITLEDPSNYQLLKDDATFNLLTVPANGGNFWCFNGAKKPMDDIKVRQAISSAINREEVIQLVGGGLGVVSGVVTPAFKELYVSPSDLPFFKYDPELAKTLLKESSVGGGFKMDCLYINTLPIMKNGAQLFKQYMEAVGIQVELRGMETNTWVETVTKTKDFYFTTNLDIGGPTPEAILTSIACGSALAGFYGPCSADIDAKVLKAAGTSDAAERKKLWRDIQMDVATFNPTAVWLFARNHVVATQKWVKDFVPFPDKAHRQMEDIWVEGKPS